MGATKLFFNHAKVPRTKKGWETLLKPNRTRLWFPDSLSCYRMNHYKNRIYNWKTFNIFQKIWFKCLIYFRFWRRHRSVFDFRTGMQVRIQMCPSQGFDNQNSQRWWQGQMFLQRYLRRGPRHRWSGLWIWSRDLQECLLTKRGFVCKAREHHGPGWNTVQ